MSVDLQELLDSNADSRTETLQDYLRNLKSLREQASDEGRQLQNLIDETQQIIEDNQEFASNFSGEVNDAQIEQYLSARERAERARINQARNQEVLNQLIPLFTAAEQRIEAIENNLEALSAGIRVNPNNGSQVPIFQDN
jgi:DNA repair exonuclease SbcCD ATPase subunit